MSTTPYNDLKLSTDNCCVVFVDYLTGFLPGLRSIDRDLYERNVTGFCLSTKALELPHCVLGDEGSFRGEFFPIVKQELADAPHFGRHTPSAWGSEQFRDWIARQAADGRRKIVLGGISIDNCTSLTALDLLDEDYEVYVVVDVSGAESILVEQAAIHRLVQAGAVPSSWVQFACEAMGDWNTPQGSLIGRIVSDHSRWGALGVPATSPAAP